MQYCVLVFKIMNPVKTMLCVAIIGGEIVQQRNNLKKYTNCDIQTIYVLSLVL